MVLFTVAIIPLGLPPATQAQQSVRTPELPLFHTFRTNTQDSDLINLGPFHGEASIDVGYEFNSNAAVNNQAPVSLNEVYEDLDVNMNWIISPLNRVNLQVDGRLEENGYSNGSNELNVAISPGSQIRLDAQIGDVTLEAFEEFSLVQDPVVDPTATGVTNLERLTNTVGLLAFAPLYRAEVGLEFDYTYSDDLSSQPEFTSLSRNSLRLGGTVGFELSPLLSYGAEASATSNTGPGSDDVRSFSFGPFLRGRLTRLIDVDLGAGINLVDAPGTGPVLYYVSLQVRYQMSRLVQCLIGFSHDLNFSSGLDLTENNNFNLKAQFQLSRVWTVSVGPFVNVGRALTGINAGSYTQYGVDTASVFLLSKRVSMNAEYRFAERNGDETEGSYIQHLVSFSLKYAF